jgi:all-trans-retinol 13,14-reductase
VINGTRYATAIAEQRFDAIVIGSGLGGLTCAALMAKTGKRVLVLERHYTAGGFTHSFRRRGYEWDVGVHYIGDVHKPHSPIRRVFDTITDGKLQWAKMDEVYDRIVIKDTYYDYHAGAAKFREGLVQHFPHAGDDIDTYLQHIRRASSSVPAHFGQRLLPGLLQGAAGSAARYFTGDYFARSTHEVLKDCTADRKLAAVLAGQWGDYGAPPKQSSFGMHALVAQHYLDGGNFPVGGASQIAKHIIPIIEASGGAVLVDAEVEQILIERGRAVGVRMHNGDALHCPQVISATGVHTTFGKLLPIDIAQRAGMLEKVDTLKRSVSHLGLYVGLKGSREDLGLEQANLWVYRDYDHDASLKRFLARPSLDFPLMYLSFPSTKDPAWAGHFPGKSTIDVIAPAPWEWFSRWKDRSWKKRGQDYEDFKARLSERLLEEIYKQAPQTRGKVDYFELSTPLSTAHFSNYAAGELYGLEHSPYRFSQRWLTPRTSVKGLHLTGQDILFCGVGSALMSGVLTASTLLGPKLLKVLPDLFAGRSTTIGSMLKTLVPKTPDAPLRPVPASTPQDVWFEATCSEIHTLTNDSKAFRFRCDAAAMRRYRPGQFVTVEAQIDGKKVCRSYTMSSTPTRPDHFEITIKRVEGGVFSNWICDTFEPGQRLRMSGPFGDFTCAPKPAKKMLLLSAGSGITPMLSMARWIVDTQANSKTAVDMVFLHAARRQEDLIFGSEVKQLGKRHAGTRVRIALSQEPSESTWRGSRGRLNATMLRRAAPDLIERDVYLCGPEGFMASARAMLIKAGLPSTQLHEESFDVSAGLSGSGGKVRFADSGTSLTSDGSQSVLELAESAGIIIPSACRTGHCGECKVRCTAGEVTMRVTDGLSEDELAEGYVLTCVGAVNGDLELAA